MIRERIKEIADFVKSESPYRSANKGWLTDDIYLQRGPNKDNASNQYDQLVKVSLFWQPIIQIALTMFLVIAIATAFAFTPLAFINGRLENISSRFEFRQVPIPIESTKTNIKAKNKFEKSDINTIDIKETLEETNSIDLKIENSSKEIKNTGLVLRF